MTDTSQPPPDPLRAWREAAGRGEAAAGDAGAPAAPDRRPTRLLVAAAGAVALAAFLAFGAAKTPLAAPAGPAVPAAPAPAPAPALTAPPTTGTPATGSARASATIPPAVGAAAVLAVRMAAPDDLYVDTAVAEAATLLHDTAVVRVAAVVLRREAGQWGKPQRAAYAVPVGMHSDQPTALASPWHVVADSVAPRTARWARVEDPRLATAAMQALEQQGYVLSGPVQLRRDPSIQDVLSASFRGRAPASTTPHRHDVWLNSTGAAVLGAGGTAAAGAPELPVPLP